MAAMMMPAPAGMAFTDAVGSRAFAVKILTFIRNYPKAYGDSVAEHEDKREQAFLLNADLDPDRMQTWLDMIGSGIDIPSVPAG